MRIEILGQDKDAKIKFLWEALEPLFVKTNGRIMVYMTSDGGPNENQRALIINIEDIKPEDIDSIILEFNPSRR